MTPVLHLGTGKKRCRNEIDGVRCPYRADGHPVGGCPTRKKRLARVARGQVVMRLRPNEIEAGSQVLDLLGRGLDPRQAVGTEDFMRFSQRVLAAAERARKVKP